MARHTLFVMAMDRLSSPKNEWLVKYKKMATFAKINNISNIELSEINAKAMRIIKARFEFEATCTRNPEYFTCAYEK